MLAWRLPSRRQDAWILPMTDSLTKAEAETSQHSPATGLANAAIEYAKKPANFVSGVATIALTAIASILIARSDFAVGAIAGVAAVAVLALW